MPKLKSRKHKVLDPLESDESFEDEEIEEGLIKDSVLQLASDRYDDFDPDEFAGSKLRNINAPQTDLAAEYKGISISRKKIANENSSDDDIDASDDEKDDDRSADDNENEENDASLSDGIETESSKEEEEGDDAVSDEDMSSGDEPLKTKGNKEKENGYSVYSKKSLDVHEDIEKGNAIRQQYEIWENLLECRIKLQKCLSATNKLPQNDNFSQLVSKLPRIDQNKISKTVKNLCGTLRTLIDLQMSLMSSQPEFSASSKLSEKRDLSSKSIDEDDAAGDADEDDDISISSSIASGFSEHQVGNAEKDEDVEKGDDDDVENDDVDEPPAKKLRKLDDFSRELNKQHTVYLPARNAAIQKWNDKTRVSSGKISSANFSAFDQSTLKQIEQILCDKERLIKRTQTKRSLYCALDPNKDATKYDQDNKKEILAEFDEEIFDDDDFYHKLLRDLIDQRSSDITDPSKMGRQWVELQKARSKMKRNIDVKSTKGRRLRYTVHQKLVNFMAPIPYNSYTDEAESELFNSLFGKLKQ